MIKVGIIGATGYVGAELVRLLHRRKDIRLTTVVSNSFAGQPFSEIYPAFRGTFDLVCDKLDIPALCEKADYFITALPHGVSTDITRELVQNGKRVIDHSADFRFRDRTRYEKAYKLTHGAPELLEKAVYGLPELYRDKIRNADLIGDPGCYPTCSILAIAPALKNGLVSTDNIIIDATSGVSGAGRKSDLAYSYCETDENFKAYGIISHRHTPEIEQELSFLAGRDVAVSFTPHLAPMKRGMLATIYMNLAKPVSRDHILEAYREFYKDEPFVRILPPGVLPETRFVVGSNRIDISVNLDERLNRLIVLSALDNMGKGSAGQAVQALNLMAGFDETEGLSPVGFFL
ncbi:MAG TPA: N-acetyl-gamma-glutamyl-phosphate reductase [Thermoclostridium caenicola]|uniref:N-acetyl-gamma-glutamyl-phosphate reductase n=1 Tax=Thermoclostridium caenicola TaxID=659425 RepID=UPI002CBD23F0|nr:N-acetyl-gamma-glutamyl-phosphate reductase [Thermoclostridium caenicola]HOK42299.1 N-acetyl-gamma-glutamyl-phosphate reductase [Thermoclostridium caenicola]HPO76785.1 N-acetyl-gamma-glutamyl-phosphate reductase [Thermoclostridium caenicola]